MLQYASALFTLVIRCVLNQRVELVYLYNTLHDRVLFLVRAF